MPPAAIAGGLVGDLAGGLIQANAASNANDAQQSVAQQQIAFEKQQYQNQQDARNKAISMAQPSASELANLGTNLDLQNQQLTAQLSALKRDNSILESIDPAIKEAGAQALQLMQGQNAAILKPLQDQQTRQRANLEQTLASRLGPDYATSSAGAQALASFDQNAQMQTAQAQQNSLGQLLGVVQGANMNPVTNASNAFSSLGSANIAGFNMSQQINQAPVNAFLGAPVNQQVNYDSAYNAAGNSTVGQAIVGQTIGNIGNAVTGMGASGLAAGSGGGSGGGGSGGGGSGGGVTPNFGSNFNYGTPGAYQSPSGGMFQ